MTDALPVPEHPPAAAVPAPPATGHQAVDEVLARADEQLAELPDTDLAGRREVLDEAHRTLRDLLDSPVTPASALPGESAPSGESALSGESGLRPESGLHPGASALPGDA